MLVPDPSLLFALPQKQPRTEQLLRTWLWSDTKPRSAAGLHAGL